MNKVTPPKLKSFGLLMQRVYSAARNQSLYMNSCGQLSGLYINSKCCSGVSPRVETYLGKEQYLCESTK